MRPLTEEETKAVFEKIAKFLDGNLMSLIDRQDEPHVFRLHRDRIYYVSERVVKMAGCIPRKQLLSLGVCFGKFTKTGRFRLGTTSLDHIARFGRHKLWLKEAGEQSFVYGNNVIKRHLGKITESIPKNAGVVVFSMSGIPLGFGCAAVSTEEIRKADTETIIMYHQADVGEYLREEADII